MATLSLRLRVTALEQSLMSNLICGPNPRICHQKPHPLASELPNCPRTFAEDLKNFPSSEIMAPHTDDATFDPKVLVPTKALPTDGDSKAHTASDGTNGNAQEHARAISNGEAKETQEPTHHASPSPPLQLRGVLKEFKSFDVTPVIGREFPEAKLAEWLRAPNSDELIRDLAITGLLISHHNTVLSINNRPTSLRTQCRLFSCARRSR